MTNDLINANRFRTTEAKLTTPHERMEWFAAHFGVEPPRLEYDKDGDLCLSDEILAFCGREGMSIDWLFLGDISGAIAAARNRWVEDREALKVFRQFDEREQKGLIVALRAATEDGMDVEEAIGLWRKVLDERKPHA